MQTRQFVCLGFKRYSRDVSGHLQAPMFLAMTTILVYSAYLNEKIEVITDCEHRSASVWVLVAWLLQLPALNNAHRNHSSALLCSCAFQIPAVTAVVRQRKAFFVPGQVGFYFA